MKRSLDARIKKLIAYLKSKRLILLGSLPNKYWRGKILIIQCFKYFLWIIIIS